MPKYIKPTRGRLKNKVSDGLLPGHCYPIKHPYRLPSLRPFVPG